MILFKGFQKYLLILVAILLAVLVVWAVKKQGGGDAAPAGGPPAGASEKSLGSFKTYTHAGYGFTFDYPADWNATSFYDGQGETVLAQPPSASDQRINPRQISGLQIYIIPFDEPGPITKERILADLPEIKINDEKQIKIAGLDALSFESAELAEIWFVREGFLYQITASANNKEVLDNAVETLRFD